MTMTRLPDDLLPNELIYPSLDINPVLFVFIHVMVRNKHMHSMNIVLTDDGTKISYDARSSRVPLRKAYVIMCWSVCTVRWDAWFCYLHHACQSVLILAICMCILCCLQYQENAQTPRHVIWQAYNESVFCVGNVLMGTSDESSGSMSLLDDRYC